MYSLDINFLSDRKERPSEAGLGATAAVVQDSPRPLYYGVAAAFFLLALVGGLWGYLQSSNRSLEQRQAELDSQLAALNAQLSEVETIQAEITQIQQQNQALATVFDRIKPWSAVLQDVRDRVPNGVQIDLIQQVAAQAQATTPPPTTDPNAVAAPPPEPPPSDIQISGHARSFNDVNDFLLTLKRSPFLNNETTRLVSAELVDNPATVEFSDPQSSGNVQVELPQVVEYTIQSSMTPIPTTQLLQDLERTLSVGLAARIQALRDRGVIQQ